MLEIALSRMLDPMAATLRSMTLAERVKEAIDAAKARGYTVAKIAAACGISDKAVYQWAAGTTKEIDGSNLAELAELSGYRPLWIMKEKGDKTDGRDIQTAVKLMRTMSAGDRVAALKMLRGFSQPETEAEIESVAADGAPTSKKATVNSDSPRAARPVKTLMESPPVEDTKVAKAYSDKKVPRLVAKYTTPTLWAESQNPRATEDD